MYWDLITKINSKKHRLNILKRLRNSFEYLSIEYCILSNRIDPLMITVVDLEDLLK
jgi:hypothetical protein